MSRKSFFHTIGRFFPTLFISFLLGGVWGFTAVTVLGIVAYFSQLGEISWHLLAGGILAVSLYFVHQTITRLSNGDDFTETKPRRAEKIVSVGSFAVAYILA